MSNPLVDYTVDDFELGADEFYELAQKAWPGDYQVEGIALAISKTLNVTARIDGKLIGSVRVLTDGYFFGTIPELRVDPDYQSFGIGRGLMERAWDASPTGLYFGAQPGKEEFYEKLGYEQSLPSYGRRKERTNPRERT